MTDRDALLCAILSAPGDDTPRLVFADWLEENGEPELAEFVRVQCEAERLSDDGTRSYCECPRCVRVAALRRRGRELRKEHGSRWAAESLPIRMINTMAPIIGNNLCWLGDVIFAWEWSRGFIGGLTLSAADWLRIADRIYWHPGQTVACDNGGNYDPRLDVAPGLQYKPHSGCPKCKGSGTVPRPFQPTAQPLTRVVLTTVPTAAALVDVIQRRDGRKRGMIGPIHRGWIEGGLAEAWPGLTFGLPGAQTSRRLPTPPPTAPHTPTRA